MRSKYEIFSSMTYLKAHVNRRHAPNAFFNAVEHFCEFSGSTDQPWNVLVCDTTEGIYRALRARTGYVHMIHLAQK